MVFIYKPHDINIFSIETKKSRQVLKDQNLTEYAANCLKVLKLLVKGVIHVGDV